MILHECSCIIIIEFIKQVEEKDKMRGMLSTGSTKFILESTDKVHLDLYHTCEHVYIAAIFDCEKGI